MSFLEDSAPVIGIGPMGLNGAREVDFNGVSRMVSVPGLVSVRGTSCG